MVCVAAAPVVVTLPSVASATSATGAAGIGRVIGDGRSAPGDVSPVALVVLRAGVLMLMLMLMLLFAVQSIVLELLLVQAAQPHKATIVDIYFFVLVAVVG